MGHQKESSRVEETIVDFDATGQSCIKCRNPVYGSAIQLTRTYRMPNNKVDKREIEIMCKREGCDLLEALMSQI